MGLPTLARKDGAVTCSYCSSLNSFGPFQVLQEVSPFSSTILSLLLTSLAISTSPTLVEGRAFLHFDSPAPLRRPDQPRPLATATTRSAWLQADELVLYGSPLCGPSAPWRAGDFCEVLPRLRGVQKTRDWKATFWLKCCRCEVDRLEIIGASY